MWPWELAADILYAAAEEGRQRVKQMVRPRRRRPAQTVRKPGLDTPVWNAVATMLQHELAPRGMKARLARYLGIPRQRVTDYITTRNRLPDAEILLRMLHWVALRRQGSDVAL
jgi:hypothetical protein